MIEDFSKGIIIVTILKKKGTMICEEQRKILNLNSHASKIITRVIKNKMGK